MKEDKEANQESKKDIHKLADHFEISVLEESLRFNPGKTEILAELGNLYTKTGRYKRGLMIDKQLVSLMPKNPVVYYNLACSYSLLQMKERSLNALTKAIELGFSDFELMERDGDLNNIRDHSLFWTRIQAFNIFHFLIL